MVLESTFICVDNSEYMRNGDFLPTRLQAQQDAAGMVVQSKLRSNPESNVGLLTFSGSEVLSTLTTDPSKVLAKLSGVKLKGDMKLTTGMKIAHMALKLRIGKNHKTRIVAFIGSPIDNDEKEVVDLAKKLKKENVNVDIVSFGEVEANTDILKKFVETLNGKDGTGSHLVVIPTGPHLSDALISSPILQGGEGGASGPSGFEFGVDPNEDPELALALRVSMEEQRARQESSATGGQPSEGGSGSTESTGENVSSTLTQHGSAQDDEQLLQRALEMSMAGDGGTQAAGEPDLASMSEEEQIAYAMSMSMQNPEPTSSSSGTANPDNKMEVDEDGKANKMEVDDQTKEEDYSEVMNDPAFLQRVLENLPGVDPQSEAVKQAVGAMTGASNESKSKEEKDKDDKDKSKK